MPLLRRSVAPPPPVPHLCTGLIPRRVTNDQLAEPLYLTARLMELAGENPFKARAYEKAGDAVTAAKDYLAARLLAGRAEALEGVGEATRQALLAIAESGSFPLLEALKQQIPPGVVELSRVRGLGAKKLAVVWRELGIDSPEALVGAAADGRLAAVKGFGAKSAQSIRASAEYYLSQRHRYRLDQAEATAQALLGWLRTLPGLVRAEPTGELRRACPTLDRLQLLTAGLSAGALVEALPQAPMGLKEVEQTAEHGLPLVSARTPEGRTVELFVASEAHFAAAWFVTTAPDHAAALGVTPTDAAPDEAALYARAGLPLIAPELRESTAILDSAGAGLPTLLEVSDLRGVVHNHSTWSDGMHSLREMALAARELGYDYLVISDHSRTAAYAGGLSIERVQAQHAEIDALNAELAPFVIYKGIESDILPDGSLDYPDAVLATFDVVIASVHSGLNMDEATATERLLTAIANPYTTILGHPTGRLLALREGYPIDHVRILEACAAHGVAIEINADPHRLDLDWAWVARAAALGIAISINPDAHSTAAYDYVRYGVLQARKGGLTAAQTLNARGRAEFDAYLAQRRARR